MLSVLLEPNAQVARKEAGEMAGPDRGSSVGTLRFTLVTGGP